MAANVSQLVSKINAVAKAIDDAQLPAVKAAALEMKSHLLAGANAFTGDGRMRNVGKSGAKLSVGYDIRAGAKPLAIMKARGPWGLVTEGAKPHTIKPKKRTKKKAVVIGGNVRNNVSHPGTSPRRIWLDSKEKGTPSVMDIISKQNIAAVRKAMG